MPLVDYGIIIVILASGLIVLSMSFRITALFAFSSKLAEN
jgi:hypothetical protein